MNRTVVHTYEIPDCEGRRYAIGDVHGCFYTLKKLLDSISLSKSDMVFLLGDMINRGKRSREVIDYIILMRSKGFQIHPIRGNHEHFILSLLEKNDELSQKTIKMMHLDFLLQETLHYKTFFENLPFYLKIKNCYLVHAGFNSSNYPLDDFESMLTTRYFSPNMSFFDTNKIIHGHTPITMFEIMKMVERQSDAINIDNGCALGDKTPGKGNLVCINIDTLDLKFEKNID